ncbi:hypothetical protein [Rubrobacter calidifluminis]|uniref:hypothetical protein n=1 Tax=Rubrobacter calidifluminis TaxID=1392640 RepID=UPI0023627CA6|nr:hypothetical protein [Rubrobacter calidifluminis]
MNKTGSRLVRFFERFSPSAQMFRGTSRGLGRGRGARLADVPDEESSEKAYYEQEFRELVRQLKKG